MTFRVDRDLLRRFGVVAAANHRTASQELRLLMERHIAEAKLARRRGPHDSDR
jgi:hypothetical protein